MGSVDEGGRAGRPRDTSGADRGDEALLRGFRTMERSIQGKPCYPVKFYVLRRSMRGIHEESLS